MKYRLFGFPEFFSEEKEQSIQTISYQFDFYFNYFWLKNFQNNNEQRKKNESSMNKTFKT